MELVVGGEPTPDRLGREAPVGERAHERRAGPQHPGHLVEHLEGPDQVVDRDRAHRPVEAGVGERQRGLAVEILDHPFVSLRVLVELEGVHAEYDETLRGPGQMRHPGAAQVEHLAVQAELVVEIAHGGDGTVVDVLHQPRLAVEATVVVLVGPAEEAVGEVAVALLARDGRSVVGGHRLGAAMFISLTPTWSHRRRVTTAGGPI